MNPKTNEIVFALIDELIDAFQAKAFHVGMDEVFLLHSDQRRRQKNSTRPMCLRKLSTICMVTS